MSAPGNFTALPARIITGLATLGPLGTKLPAPGTWGSIIGVLLYCVVFAPLNNSRHWGEFLFVELALVAVAIFACEVAEKHLKKTDPGCVILDEVVAMPLVFSGMGGVISTAHYPWAWYLAGFLLFRFFDILKPFGIKKLQQAHGGIGVILDDLAASGAACGAIHLLHFLLGFLR